MSRFIKILVSMCCLISSGVAVVLCSNKKKYEWTASVTAPDMYPIQVHRSIFIYDDGYTYLDSGDYLKSGWGKSGRKNYTDTKSKPIPYRLVINWLSWNESKFYKGVFELPKEKMERLFQEGYLNRRGERENYDIILVGMAPEGVVVVWLLGNDACIEIERFQAEVTDEFSTRDIAPGSNGLGGEYPSLKQFAEDIMQPEIKEYIENYGLSNHIWDRYRTKFLYRTLVQYESDSGKTNRLRQELYNGERRWLTPAEMDNPSYLLQARAKEIIFDWFDGEDIYRGFVTFDEREIPDIYEQIYKDTPEGKGEIVIKVNRANDDIDVFFRSGKGDGTGFKEIMIHNAKIEIYKQDRAIYE